MAMFAAMRKIPNLAGSVSDTGICRDGGARLRPDCSASPDYFTFRSYAA